MPRNFVVEKDISLMEHNIHELGKYTVSKNKRIENNQQLKSPLIKGAIFVKCRVILLLTKIILMEPNIHELGKYTVSKNKRIDC